jgi:hypothetical protein
MSESSEVITIRVPRGTKAVLKKNKIRLSKDIREFINARVNAAKFLKEYRAIEARARKRKVSGDSAAMIREDRDSR